MNSFESNIMLVNNALQQKKRTFQTEIGIGMLVMLGIVLVYRFYHHPRNKLKNNYMFHV